MSKRYTRSDDRKAELEALGHNLKLAVARMQSDSLFQGWARLAARLNAKKSYSFCNMMLVYIQCPEATMVRGYNEWRELGRQVRKGAKSISIRFPFGKKDEDGDGYVGGFGWTTVHDISATDVIEGGGWVDMPEVSYIVNGDCDPSLFDNLVQFVTAQGYAVTTDPRNRQDGEGGWHDRENKKIFVNPDTYTRMISVLAHEIAHALDTVATSKPEREAVAEGVAYMVSVKLGLDTSTSSIPYIATWLGQKDGNDVLTKHMTNIVKIANQIVEGITPSTKDTTNNVLTQAA